MWLDFKKPDIVMALLLQLFNAKYSGFINRLNFYKAAELIDFIKMKFYLS